MKRQIVLLASALSLTLPALAQGARTAVSPAKTAPSAPARTPSAGDIAAQAAMQPQRGSHEKKAMKVTADTPMWQRYLAAAEEFKMKGDPAREKQYLFEALTQLEKHPPAGHQLTGRLSRLQHDLLHMYPSFPRQEASEPNAAQLKMDEEQVSVLSRLNQINRAYPTPNNLMYRVVETQIKLVNADIEKNKAAAKAGNASGKTSGKETTPE